MVILIAAALMGMMMISMAMRMGANSPSPILAAIRIEKDH